MAFTETRSRRIPLPLVGGAYLASDKAISAQEAVNCFPEVAKESTNPVVMRSAPGGLQFADLGAPIRGLERAYNVLYVAAGDKIYTVSSSGAATLIGSIRAGSGPVSMTENIIELLVVSEGIGYTVQKTSGLLQTVADFPDTIKIAYIDDYILLVERNSGRFWWTNISDADTITGTDFATSEGSPDNLVSILTDHREIWLFGEETTEIWYNDGSSPFSRAPGGFLEKGCAATHSPGKLDNTVFWLGNDYVVYKADGAVPVRVSTHAIEKIIRDVGRPESAEAMTYTQDGHAFYQLTFPGQATITYDASTGYWHTRRLYGRKDTMYRHHAYCYGKHLVAGEDGKIYQLDQSVNTFSGIFERVRSYGPIRGNRFNTMHNLTVLFSTGGTSLNPAKVFLEISDDGGRTFEDRIEGELGSIGDYNQEVVFSALGGFWDNQRVIRLTVTDDVDFALIDAFVEVS